MRYKESQIKNIEWPKFEDFITFQYVFMKVVKVSCAKNYG